MATDFNDPNIDALGFLFAVMHDRRLPMVVRMDAATKLLPFHRDPPSEVLTIRINGGVPADYRPRKPRDDNFDWADRAPGPYNKWPN
jgi:hypothetical protein